MADWSVPVRLEYATAQDFSSGAASFRGIYVRVKVRNLAFDKQVRLHFRADSQWSDADLDWTANYGSYDVFSAARAPYTNEFAVSYYVGGRTYWDNNDSRNYSVPNFRSAVGGRVMLRRARLTGFAAFQTNVSGTLFVENLSFRKKVGIRLSPDGGASWVDVDARYVGVASEGSNVALGPVEQWDYTSPVFNTGAYVLAAYYSNLETGEWYWDNNFGQDYRLSGQPEIE